MNFRLAHLSAPALAAASWLSACSSSSSSGAGNAAAIEGAAKSDAGATAMADAAADAAAPSTLANGCPQNSGFAADDMCLPPPASTDGFQLHYGPDDYADPAKVAPFILEPGKETNDCFYEKTSNDVDRYISGYQFWMRPGSHHIIMNVNPTAQADGFATCQANDQTPGLLGASETPKLEELPGMDAAPENQGLAVKVPAHSQAVVNFHVINTSAKPILREAWLNYFYIDQTKVTGLRGNVFLAGGLSFQITPGTKQTYQYACSPKYPTRIIGLAAHMHAHTTRLSMWKVSGGQATLIYESYDWANPASFLYDTVHKNPTPDRAAQVAGATSGTLVLQPTDTLQWECAVDNTSDVTLTFRNEVYTGEMCVVGGTMVRADEPMSPYDFFCALN